MISVDMEKHAEELSPYMINTPDQQLVSSSIGFLLRFLSRVTQLI